MLIKKYKHLIEVVNNQSQVFSCQQMKSCPTPKLLQQPHVQRHCATHLSYTLIFGGMSMVLLLLLPFNCVNTAGYSYTHFVGPVAGPERKIFVHDDSISSHDGKTPVGGGSSAPSFDYAGKPEYEFAYGVEDADAHILHNRNEMRDGDSVKGVYSLIDPDGTLRVVKYTADEMNGFQAKVIRNGVSSLHGQLQPDYHHVPPPNIVYNSHYNPSYNPHFQAPKAHFNGDGITGHPSSFNTYKSSVAQVPPNEYEPPPHLPIIYHYNKNYDANDGNENGDGVYDGRKKESEDRRPQYEVREKPEDEENQEQRSQYKVHENQDEHLGYKSNNHANNVRQNGKPQQLEDEDDDDSDADDDDDDDDDDAYSDDDDEAYDDMDDSDEVDDYDESIHANYNNDEVYEYY